MERTKDNKEADIDTTFNTPIFAVPIKKAQ
ncbi:hypothetical protein AYI69_g10443, partial [Smittium culicis]